MPTDMSNMSNMTNMTNMTNKTNMIDKTNMPVLKTIQDYKTFLRSFHLRTSLPTKEQYRLFLQSVLWHELFPWRSEQVSIIQQFLSGSAREIVIQAIFGNGKTTLLLGLVGYGVFRHKFRLDELFFTAFNVCIKNEIRSRLRNTGFKRFPHIRTFDSLIYQICQHYGFPHLRLPDYQGKRRFVLRICKQILHQSIPRMDVFDSIRYVFVDESQDLEQSCYLVFTTFFPNASFIFVGDIFQSVQKEPRESLLWHLSQTIRPDRIVYNMMETPRVPPRILDSIRSALVPYYPEYSDTIQQWRSTSTIDDSSIEWCVFSSYKDLFRDIEVFLQTYPPSQCMILTFSSSITVRGSLGDVARIRNFLATISIPVNQNHKKMDPDRLFLSTANSSKGLERDYVLILLSFPLEKAFINFSNDLTTNLVTVALTRTKKLVKMYVPLYQDKYSIALNLYPDCPRPNTLLNPSVNTKPQTQFDMQDYLGLEHSVTEILRQNIVSFPTRMLFRSCAKLFHTRTLSDSLPKPPRLPTEELQTVVGVVLENLITSQWKNSWPSLFDLSSISSNPMYSHCLSKILVLQKQYSIYIRRYPFSSTPLPVRFRGIAIFSRLQMAFHHKLFFTIDPPLCAVLLSYYESCRPTIQSIRPPDPIKIQSNCRMSLVTGIIDCLSDDTVYEIKASHKADWKDDAFCQAFMYFIMMGKKFGKIVLINLFKNQVLSYSIKVPDVKQTRQALIDDVLLWNGNCFLAKHLHDSPPHDPPLPVFPIDRVLFVHLLYHDHLLVESTAVFLKSPSRCELAWHYYTSTGSEEGHQKDILTSLSVEYDDHVVHVFSSEPISFLPDARLLPCLSNEKKTSIDILVYHVLCHSRHVRWK